MHNLTSYEPTCLSSNDTKCVNGIILSVWHPINEISDGDRIIRSAIYFILMCYLFLGVSIIADRFMAGIEMITSQERKYITKDADGVVEVIYVKVWNKTVSNLTLMALGSSAPEILLSIIETIGKNFQAGELGPGTIVGSAAFNLFVIIGICVIAVPKNQSRKTKHLSVFIITTTWSLFAYLWLYLILVIISPRIIDVWEAVLTFVFFPITVIMAYIFDRKLFFKNFLLSKVLEPVRIESRRTSSVTSGRAEKKALGTSKFISDTEMNTASVLSFENENFEDEKMEYIQIIKQIRFQHKTISLRELEIKAEIELMKRRPKSRAYYRRKAMRYLTGCPDPMKYMERQLLSSQEAEMENISIGYKQELVFTPDHYTVYENDGKVALTVTRFGSLITSTIVELDYFTEDGSAQQGEDYVNASGTLRFECGQSICEIIVEIIDDDIYEEDEYFVVRLANPRLVYTNDEDLEKSLEIQLGSLKSAVVLILDDDYGGTFHFEAKKMSISENVGNLEVKVIRSSGARGEVQIPYKTFGSSALGGIQYQDTYNSLIFQDNQTEGIINISIYDENEYEKNLSFFLELKDPIFERKSLQNTTGNPRLGEYYLLEIVITENPDLRNVIDKLIFKKKIKRIVYSSTWKDQFCEALSVGGDSRNPKCGQYILHYLSLFWKLLFALVPPPNIWNGWLCFIVSIIVIGFLTAIIGDLASMFGCHVGLTDSVTAITFVALGTSLPDTFASKVAAVNDKTADASIGNVVGSNAVNVFLGIGIAWSIASIYHAIHGTQLVVESGSLGFSVTLFTFLALIALTTLMIRRHKFIGGELGGPTLIKYATGALFLTLWFLYVLISSLEIYCHIDGF